MAKDKFKVLGKELTANEMRVLDFVKSNGTVDYKAVAEGLELSPKSASSTLARLQSTHGLLNKNVPQTATSYNVTDEAMDAEVEAPAEEVIETPAEDAE